MVKSRKRYQKNRIICFSGVNKQIKTIGRIIMVIESIALFALLLSFKAYVALLIYPLYLLYIGFIYKYNCVQIVLIKNTRTNFNIFMNEFYQVFLPIAILVLIAGKGYILLLCMHILFFPRGIYTVFKNCIPSILKLIIK